MAFKLTTATGQGPNSTDTNCIGPAFASYRSSPAGGGGPAAGEAGWWRVSTTNKHYLHYVNITTWRLLSSTATNQHFVRQQHNTCARTCVNNLLYPWPWLLYPIMLRHGGRWWPLRTTSGIASGSAVVAAHRSCRTTVRRDGRERMSPNISELRIPSAPRVGGLSPAVRWMGARARLHSGWRTVLGARLGITASGSPQIMEGQLFPASTVTARAWMELWSQDAVKGLDLM